MKQMCLINCRSSRSVHLWQHSSSAPASAMSAAQTWSGCQPEPLCLLGIRHLFLTCRFMDDILWPASASFEDERRTAPPYAPHTRRGLPYSHESSCNVTSSCLWDAISFLPPMLGAIWRSFPLRCAVLANLFPVHLPLFFLCVGMPRLLDFAFGACEHVLANIAYTLFALGKLYCGVFLLRFHCAALRALELLAVFAHAPKTLRRLCLGKLLLRFHSVTLRALLQRAQPHAVTATPVLAPTLSQLFGGEVTPL